MEMTSEEINKISREVQQETLPVINSAIGVANKMGERNTPDRYLGVHLEDQEHSVGLDETQPIRAMKFTAPDDEAVVYARVDAYRDNGGVFSFKLYRGDQAEALKTGSAEQIAEHLASIVRVRIQHSNLAKRGYGSVHATHVRDEDFNDAGHSGLNM